jgi:hypothetical protein
MFQHPNLMEENDNDYEICADDFEFTELDAFEISMEINLTKLPFEIRKYAMEFDEEEAIEKCITFIFH